MVMLVRQDERSVMNPTHPAYCSACGAAFDVDSAFCAKCGEPRLPRVRVSRATAPDAPPEHRNLSNRQKNAVFALLVGGALVVYAGWSPWWNTSTGLTGGENLFVSLGGVLIIVAALIAWYTHVVHYRGIAILAIFFAFGWVSWAFSDAWIFVEDTRSLIQRADIDSRFGSLELDLSVLEEFDGVAITFIPGMAFVGLVIAAIGCIALVRGPKHPSTVSP